MPPVSGQTSDGTLAGVFGENTGPGGVGVAGVSRSGDGVRAFSINGNGLSAFSDTSTAVFAKAKSEPGVSGLSDTNDGVRAVSVSGNGLSAFSETSTAVFAKAKSQPGVSGLSDTNDGVRAVSVSGNGLSAFTRTGAGVFGQSDEGGGVHGQSNSASFSAVSGIQLNPASIGAGVFGEHRGAGPAGFFKGDVIVTGDVKLPGADLAEDFAIGGETLPEPGTVVALDDDGAVRPSRSAYDPRVVGVVSGAGSCRPAIIMDRQASERPARAIALVGKTYCKADACYGPIGVGDLLTTSPREGHAMKALDPERSFGAVIGKAIGALHSGVGLIPILVCLR